MHLLTYDYVPFSWSVKWWAVVSMGCELWQSGLAVTVVVTCLVCLADGDIRLVENIDFNPEWMSSWLYQGIPNATEYYVITNPGFPYTACSAFTRAMQEVVEYKVIRPIVSLIHKCYWSGINWCEWSYWLFLWNSQAFQLKLGIQHI